MGQISNLVEAINIRCDPFTTEPELREFSDRVGWKSDEIGPKKEVDCGSGLAVDDLLA
jgi:hypothetical protein